MGRLLRLDVRPVDCTGQESRNKTVRDWRDMETPAGQVPPAGVRAGIQGSLRDGTASRRSGSGDWGAIHAARLQWAQISQEEDWGFLLIDARNAFNEENRTAMLWAARHKWPSGAQFTFNCYRHWSTLVVRNNEDGSGHFLHIKEGVT